MPDPRTATSPTAGDRMLDLRDVTVRFGGIRALDSVSLSVDHGTVCGLIGPNGAGKTTLFDVVAGVRRPNTGRVVFDGVDVSRWGVASRARAGIRRTFQRVQAFGWLTVEDNVLTALESGGRGGGLLTGLFGSPTRTRREKARRAQVEKALELCGLMDVRREYAGSLPIGLARMVELARATVEPPKLLMLDEPASGLDEVEAERLGQRIQSVRRENRCAVLLVEHNAGFVMRQCDHVVVLDVGRVLAEGSPATIQSDAAVRAAYLGDGAAAVESGSPRSGGGDR
jgi:branched-chain amino acid transport system ATP-binding protein